MDETYIQMAKEAVEIQEQWNVNIADKCVLTESTGKFEVSTVNTVSTQRYLRVKKNPRVAWLPRQEDLQKIYKELKELSFDCCYKQFKRWDAFRYQQEEFEHGQYSFNIFETGSWEVLWLCFVMETCYNKRWNGNTWEVIKDE